MSRLLLICLLALSACASPNLDSFQESTNAVTGLIVSNGEKLEAELGRVASTFRDADDREEFVTRKARIMTLYNRAIKAQSIMDAYAKGVARVADAGVEGEEATTLFLASLNDLKQTFSADAVFEENETSRLSQTRKAAINNEINREAKSSSAEDKLLLSENDITTVGKIINAIQGAAGNKTLYDIMNAAHAGVENISKKITAVVRRLKGISHVIYKTANDNAPDDSEEKSKSYDELDDIIVAIRLTQSTKIRTHIIKCAEEAKEGAIKPCDCKAPPPADSQQDIPPGTGTIKCTIGDYVAEREAEGKESEQAIAESVKVQSQFLPGKLALASYKAENLAFRNKLNKQFDLLNTAAKEWVRDHEKVVRYLKDCKGWSGVFKSKCKAFSAENLKLGATVLKSLGLF